MAKKEFDSWPLYDALHALGLDEEKPLSDEERAKGSRELQDYIDRESRAVLRRCVRFRGHGSGMLRAELTLPAKGEERLRGSGLAVVNPPWKLEGELGVLLPALAQLLAGASGHGGTRIGWLTGET